MFYKRTMKNVYNEADLAQAIKQKESCIAVHGNVAKKFRNLKKKKRAAKIGGGLLFLGGLAAAPFTGGTSAAASAAGVCALTAGSLTISTAELAIICGTAIALAGLSRNYDVEFKSDGSVILRKKGK